MRLGAFAREIKESPRNSAGQAPSPLFKRLSRCISGGSCPNSGLAPCLPTGRLFAKKKEWLAKTQSRKGLRQAGKKRENYLRQAGKRQRVVRFLCGLAPLREKRNKRRDARNEKQEKRAKKLDPFSVRFLCVFAPLREKRKKSRACRRQVFRTSYFKIHL